MRKSGLKCLWLTCLESRSGALSVASSLDYEQLYAAVVVAFVEKTCFPNKTNSQKWKSLSFEKRAIVFVCVGCNLVHFVKLLNWLYVLFRNNRIYSIYLYNLFYPLLSLSRSRSSSVTFISVNNFVVARLVYLDFSRFLFAIIWRCVKIS